MTQDDRKRTIVVGYDGSQAARRGLQRLRQLGAPGATVVVVAVGRDVRSPGLGAQLTGQEVDVDSLLQEARDLLQGAPALGIEARAETGDPVSVLVEVAREVDADLLVVGRRGGDFVARTLLGSVASRVIEQAPCDVLVVR
ncbi:MAG: universal stress protein [Solirubrobacteraceae bacterium]